MLDEEKTPTPPLAIKGCSGDSLARGAGRHSRRGAVTEG